MTKYLTIVIILLSSFSVYAEQAKKEEMKTEEVGSFDDSGRVDADTYKFSNAEKKLWFDKHLLNIEQPARLHYEFVESGSYEEGFVDDVYLDIIRINDDGTRDALLDFFSGERKQNVTPDNVKHITGNPVIGIYMQGDVYEMNRLTDGYWKYFQRQLKLAIAASNESEKITFNFDGKTYQGEKITLNPFDKVQKKERLKEFSHKRYEFILSEEIPGKLYKIRTVIDDVDNPDAPLIEETLTLKNVEFSSEVVAKKEN